jgi:hypothetical protein
MLLGGCGPNVAGEYKCGGGLLDVVKLQSGGKVYVTASLRGARMSGEILDGGALQGKCTAQ